MDNFESLKNNLSSFLYPESERKEPEKDDESKMWSLVESSQIHFNNRINKPPAIMSINQDGKHIPIFTNGNFSLLKGQAKSRKTFALSMIASALSYDFNLYDTFVPNMKGKTTLFIDTEQSDYHVYRFVNSVVNVANADGQSSLFIAVALRKYETEMRLKIVEFLIYNSKNLGYVIIDGIRDLIKDFNSLDESTKIGDKLLKWTKERNIHISVVLHENPSKDGSNNKARGHLGTELTNKAETIIRFEKNRDNKKQTIIMADDTRGEEFEPIYFEIEQNELGLYPIIVQKEFETKQVTPRF